MSQEKTLVVIVCMHRCRSSLTGRRLQRPGMVSVLRLGSGWKGRRDTAHQEMSSKPCSDGQDALSLAIGLHYCERKTHAGN